LLLTVLLPILVGIINFGIAIGNYLALTNATAMAAQTLSISRTQTTDPCKAAYNAFEVAAPTLNTKQLQFTIVVNAAPPSTSQVASLYSGGAPATCAGAEPVSSTNTSWNPSSGNTASVKVTYPCSLKIVGVNYAPNCTLTAQTSEAIQ
jgi:Flp pilus assembly protein TadG